MTPLRTTLVGLGATATLMGGIDASVMNETPLERVEIIAEERVEAKQIENVVETTLPWKDQPGIKVKYDLGEPTLGERLADKRKQEVVTEVVPFADSQGFKVDILLNERPATNCFTYQLEGWEQYDFYYQPALTDEEIAEGASRPEEIVGSYAVYHKTLKNHQLGQENYATGKFAHIPYPYVWEVENATDTKHRAESFAITDGQMQVCVSADWLDKATYPVRVDPTFGYTSVGASAHTPGIDNYILLSANSYSPSVDGRLQSISVYFQSYDQNIRYGLYTSSGSRVTAASPSSGPAGTFNNAWTTINQNNEALSSGTSYHVALEQNGGPTLRYDSIGISFKYFNHTLFTDFPSSATLLDFGSNFQHSMYSTFAENQPLVSTNGADAIRTQKATISGSLQDEGNSSVTQHGFAYGTLSNLQGGDTSTTTLGAGTQGQFSQVIFGLNLNTTYYYRAYATNASGTGFGSILSFTTNNTEPAIIINNARIHINNAKVRVE